MDGPAGHETKPHPLSSQSLFEDLEGILQDNKTSSEHLDNLRCLQDSLKILKVSC